MERKLCLLLILVNSTLWGFSQPQNLFEASAIQINCEDGVVATVDNNAGKTNSLLVTSKSSTRAPSIYFGSVKVSPGKKYTYFVRGAKKASCRILLYVISSKNNILWPGADLEKGIARSTFVAPDSIHEITLGLTFLYPQKIDSVEVEDIALFEGDVDQWNTDKMAMEFKAPLHRNLIGQDHLKISCESGVAASMTSVDDKNYLKVKSAPSARGPSIYFATLKVIPGAGYTYFLKSSKLTSGRILLYVTTPNGNLVWPGGELENGIARTYFNVPADVEQVTLAITFLEPQHNESILVEDAALFRGYVAEWQASKAALDFSPLFRSTPPLAKYILLVSFIAVFIVVLLERKSNIQIEEKKINE